MSPAFLAPAAVVAQDQDVMVDPDSPSGTEYAIPFERARDKAARGDQPAARTAGERSAPLFGEGIEATDAKDDSVDEVRGRQPAAGDDHGRGRPARGKRSHSDEVRIGGDAVLASSRTVEAGPGGALLTGALAVLALSLGAAIGLLLRRRRRSE